MFVQREDSECCFIEIIFNRETVVGYDMKQENQIYRMLFKSKRAKYKGEANVAKTDFQTWHERLGHINSRAMQQLMENKLVKRIEFPINSKSFCGPCLLGKSHQQPFRKTRVRAETVPGEVIHTDVCRPMKEELLGGARFLLMFKDDATSFRYIYFLKHKSDVLEKFKKYDKLIENKFGRAM